MEKYFKNIDNDYITSISTGSGQVEITQEEYNNILTVIRNKPITEVGYDYKLCTDLTWESYEVEVIPENEVEITDDEL